MKDKRDLDSAFNDGFKRIREIPWVWMWIAMFFALWAWPIQAQVTTYSYTGKDMSGFIELAQPLQPNTTVTITPNIQGFTDGTLLSIPGTVFTLTTDSGGNIAEWNYEVTLDFACNCDLTILSTNANDTASTGKNQPSATGLVWVTTVTNIYPPGQWTMTAGPPMMAQQAKLATYLADAQWYLADDLLAQRDKRNALALVVTCRANKGVC